MIEGAYAVGAENALIPGIVRMALEIGWCGTVLFDSIAVWADLPGQGEGEVGDGELEMVNS